MFKNIKNNFAIYKKTLFIPYILEIRFIVTIFKHCLVMALKRISANQTATTQE